MVFWTRFSRILMVLTAIIAICGFIRLMNEDGTNQKGVKTTSSAPLPTPVIRPKFNNN